MYLSIPSERRCKARNSELVYRKWFIQFSLWYDQNVNISLIWSTWISNLYLKELIFKWAKKIRFTFFLRIDFRVVKEKWLEDSLSVLDLYLTSDPKKQFAKSTFQKAARKWFNKLLANTVFPFLFKRSFLFPKRLQIFTTQRAIGFHYLHTQI